MNEVFGLLDELAKPVAQIQRSHVLATIGSLDGCDVDQSPMILFLLESLFDFASRPGCPVSMKDLVRAVLANATLTPVLYQVALPRQSDDPELDQMLNFVHSFKRE